MDLMISQGGCFDRTIIVQGFARFSRQEARLCRAECPPHFLFVLPKRKRAGHGTKEKALGDELPGKAVNSPKTGAGRHELPTELETPLPAALYLNLKSVRRRICGHGAQRGANRTSPAPLSAAAPPSNSGRGFQRGGTLPSSPVPLGVGFQRRGPRPPAFVSFQGGAGGKIEIPPRFSLGGPGGHSLFKREYPLWLLVPETGTALCGSKENVGDILHGKAVLSMHRIAVLLFCLINLKWTEMSTFCKSLLHRIKPMMDRNRFNSEDGMEQKIKQDINIGANIRAIRKQKNIKQVDLVRLLQLEGVEITRETLVKIESGVQHIKASQLRGIRDALGTTYDELLK